MSYSQFVMKLTAAGGPPPEHELASLARLADENGGCTWIGSHKPGAKLLIQADSRCLAIAHAAGGDLVVLAARIVGRSQRFPSDPGLRELYAGHEFPSWWQLEGVRLLRLPGLHALPGRSSTGRPASQTFSGSASFAYWEGLPADQGAPASTARALRPVPGASGRVSASSLGAAPTAPADSAPDLAMRPPMPLYGVDFSGARETGGRNRKLWVAAWPVDGPVTLACGADGPGFGRRALADLISRSPGLWVVDFPFGPQADVAAAMRWQRWEDYLQWTTSSADATGLRDEARERLEAQGLRWSLRRRVDRAMGTTWFPFFEQLYRQTLRGASDVLLPLSRARPAVRILPWDALAAGGEVQVVEGFPGLAIERLGLTPTGYKGEEADHLAKRAAILERLAVRVPLGPDVLGRAIEDTEGDAVDALVLLSSALATATRPPDDWRRVREQAVAGEWAVEGWFFD